MSSGVIIIAEAGVNHNGSPDIARQMVAAAAEAKADMIKFQTFRADEVVTFRAAKANYQQQHTERSETQWQMLKKLELSLEDHQKIIENCKKRDIQFLSTAFGLNSIALLDRLGQRIWKIPSGEITNLPYLRKIGSLAHEVILSTGMADLGEIEDAIEVLEDAGTLRKKIAVLHCNTEYPTPMQDVNLRAMQTIAAAFPGIRVGYSDHTLGIEVPIAAVAMGASVIEKHFTLDRDMPGPDHKASLEPEELAEMVQAIRNIEKALGNGIKRPSPSELKNKSIARKSIVASRDITAGERFSESNLTTKRPGTGISPMRWDEVIGQDAIRDYKADDMIDA